MTPWSYVREIRERVGAERGILRSALPAAVALCHPSPYRVAMSSLGYQAIYREIHRHPGAGAERAFLPDDPGACRRARLPVVTYEGERPLTDFPIVAFSIACELELPGILEMLDLCGIPLLRQERSDRHPVVIAGGPLTYSNPAPLSPFVDLVAMGEGEELIHEFLSAAAELGRSGLLDHCARLPGFYIPGLSGDLPPIAQAPDERLPACSQIVTRNTVLSSMFLVEPERGCSRGCTYCVMRCTTNGGMRIVPPEEVLALLPGGSERVGLVGAAVTDHPGILELVSKIVDGGRGIGISSLRADRLSEPLVLALARGGYRTLTTASDGASERIRRLIGRKTREDHLIRAAELARHAGMKRLKLYEMVGLPGETSGDIAELVRLALELAKITPLSLGIAPFVAKRNTPLDGAPFEPIPSIEAKLAAIRLGLKGKVDVRPSSARWAWVEYMLAQGGEAAGLAAMDAWRAGGSFASWKRAFADRGARPHRRSPCQ